MEVKINTDAGKENKCGCTKMGDPAGEEQKHGSLRYIRGAITRVAKKIADMIQCHNHHHQAPKDIDGL